MTPAGAVAGLGVAGWVVLAAFAVSGCSSIPSASVESALPAWTQAPARTVENGYIIYVGSGEDTHSERAHFKAEGMAIQDLANECSLAPKGTRVEDHLEKAESNSLVRAWVKIAIAFDECEDAKKAAEPEAIRKLASLPLTEQLKRYQELVDEPLPDEPEETLASGEDGTNPALGNTSSGAGVHDTASFFWMRQRVSYAKQIVILSPPSAYPPEAPQTAQFIHRIRPAQASIQQYAAINPAFRSGHDTYSRSPVRADKLRIRRQRLPSPVHAGDGLNPALQPHRAAHPPKPSPAKRRRRHF